MPLSACFAAVAGAACVPPDEAIGLGSVQFVLTASRQTREGLSEYETLDGWSVRFDRVVLGFKTMTIGRVGVPDVCSYRGRGASTDVVVNPSFGVVQTFNGLQPVECPDVGLILGPPGNATTLGAGVTSKDLVDLAMGEPAHAIVEATAVRVAESAGWPDRRPLHVLLRFDSVRTSSRFGGCKTSFSQGVQIVERERDEVPVRFAAEHLFHESLSLTAKLRVRPFEQADDWGDGDRVVTMEELDALPLAVAIGDYRMDDGTANGSLGDYVRFLFRFTIKFRTDQGLCLGNDPGSGEGDDPGSGEGDDPEP